MTQSYSVNEFVGHFKPAIEQSDWKSSQALNPCFSRCESPPVLPPPDFFPSSTSRSTKAATAATSSTATPTPPSTSWASASRPCFSAKTRSLFRQRIIKMRKENSTGPPSALPFTTSPAAVSQFLYIWPNRINIPGHINTHLCFHHLQKLCIHSSKISHVIQKNNGLKNFLCPDF